MKEVKSYLEALVSVISVIAFLISVIISIINVTAFIVTQTITLPLWLVITSMVITLFGSAYLVYIHDNY